MTSSASAGLERVLGALAQDGMLVHTDSALPSLVGLVAGAQVRGSWWSHPRGRDIYAVDQQLAKHRDVVMARLIIGKWTYVHRRLWPALLSAGAAREPWQMADLPDAARLLLDLVIKDGTLRTDDAGWLKVAKGTHAGDATRELELKLLVHTCQVHTHTGAHAKVLQTWERWESGVDMGGERIAPAAAKAEFEHVLSALNARYGGSAWLPWQAATAKHRGRKRT